MFKPITCNISRHALYGFKVCPTTASLATLQFPILKCVPMLRVSRAEILSHARPITKLPVHALNCCRSIDSTVQMCMAPIPALKPERTGQALHAQAFSKKSGKQQQMPAKSMQMV